jgi:hypothetical protein
MELRYLTIPADNPEIMIGKAPLSFLMVADHILNNDQRFTRNARGMRDGVRLLGKLEGAKPGDVVVLDDADWRLLRDAFEEPSDGYLPPLTKTDERGAVTPFKIGPRVLVPFCDALSDANTKHEPKAAEPKAEELPS